VDERKTLIAIELGERRTGEGKGAKANKNPEQANLRVELADFHLRSLKS
jgi:hypothetical protein